MNNANYVPYSYLSAYYDKMSVLIYDAILLCPPKTSVKFLISFVSPIFPPQGLSFWHQPLSSLAALERHLKRNDRCDRKTQKKCRKRERQKGEETRTSLQFLEPQINLIQGYMTTNINITQTWWRLLSAVGSTLITLVVWLGYMALCMVGEVILGIVKFIFGIIISILSMVVLIGTFIWLLTL